MTGYRIREVLFGNWRNKGVALFFAVTIWVVAYQAETQKEIIPVRLKPEARQEGLIIIRQECADKDGKSVAFDGTILVTVTGPRRQVEKLKADPNVREVRFPVEVGADPTSDQKRVGLSAESFPFIPPGVKITEISPDSILITFDTAVERELPVEPVYQRVPEGMEAEPPKIEPPTVKLHGPRSLLEGMRATVEPWLGAAERFEEVLAVNKRYPETFDKGLVDRTVRFIGPSQVKISVRLRYKSDSFDADGVRVRFLVPPSKSPFRIQFDEETVKVRFQGPVGEIRRLRERVASPDFALAVRIPPVAAGDDAGRGEGERTVPFTEDNFILYGFSEKVQILQHPQRQAQGKGPWTYTIVPVPAAPKPGG